MEKIQTIYINLDDSGKISSKEKVCAYGGIVFFNKEERDNFARIYKSILTSIKCHYCNNKEKCNHKCPEIKNNNIEYKDRRRLLNFVKKYYLIGFAIENNRLYENIIRDPSSKGRFTDFCIKVLIKNLLLNCIENKKINPNLPLKLVINIDQSPTRTNGYYTLDKGIYEELKHGFYNYNYQIQGAPIINNDLEISIQFINSSTSYLVQASDIIVGNIRYYYLNNRNINDFIDYYKIFP